MRSANQITTKSSPTKRLFVAFLILAVSLVYLRTVALAADRDSGFSGTCAVYALESESTLPCEASKVLQTPMTGDESLGDMWVLLVPIAVVVIAGGVVARRFGKDE